MSWESEVLRPFTVGSRVYNIIGEYPMISQRRFGFSIFKLNAKRKVLEL